jgi:hypothetical protein
MLWQGTSSDMDQAACWPPLLFLMGPAILGGVS